MKYIYIFTFLFIFIKLYKIKKLLKKIYIYTIIEKTYKMSDTY